MPFPAQADLSASRVVRALVVCAPQALVQLPYGSNVALVQRRQPRAQPRTRAILIRLYVLRRMRLVSGYTEPHRRRLISDARCADTSVSQLLRDPSSIPNPIPRHEPHLTTESVHSPIIPRVPRRSSPEFGRPRIQPLGTFIPPPRPHRIAPPELFALLFDGNTRVQGFIVCCWVVRWVCGV